MWSPKYCGIDNNNGEAGEYLNTWNPYKRLFLGQTNVQFSAEQCVTAVIIGRLWAFQHVMLRLYLADWAYYISQVPTVQFTILYLPNVCFGMK